MRCEDIWLQKGISHLLNIITTFLLMYDRFHHTSKFVQGPAIKDTQAHPCILLLPSFFQQREIRIWIQLLDFILIFNMISELTEKCYMQAPLALISKKLKS